MRKTRVFAKTVCYPSKTIYRHALQPGVYARCWTDFGGKEAQHVCLFDRRIDNIECALKGAAPALFGAE